MWDESLPAYTGSFSDNVILFTLYFKVFLFYLIIALGIITALSIFLLPLFGCFLTYKSIVIKLKKNKQHKHDHKKYQKQKQNEEDAYLKTLDKKIKKKKKKL